MDSNIIGQSATSLTVATDKFLGIYSSGAAWAATATSGAGLNIMPIAGTLKNLYINCDTAPGAGLTRTFTVYKNGSDTGLTVSLTGASATTGNDTNAGHNVTFVATDTISIHTTATGTTAASGITRWTLGLTAAANTSCLLSGSGAAMGTAFPVVISPQSANLITGTAVGTGIEAIMPTNGTIKNAYVVTNTAIAGATNLTFTLFQNGSSTSLAIVCTGDGSTTRFSDTSHSVSVSAGDRLFWTVTTSAAPASKTSFLSAEFDPTTNGESVHMFGGGPNDIATAVRYNTVAQSGLTYTATETAREALSQATTWQKLYVYEQGALSTGQYVIRPAINGTLTGPSVTITSASQTGNDTVNTATTNAGDTISMSTTPSGTPTVTVADWGIVSFIQPTVIPIGRNNNINQAVNRAGTF